MAIVKLLRHIMALMVLVAWLPATTHCLMGACLQESKKGGCCGELQGQQHKHDDPGGCGMCSLGAGEFLVPATDVFIANFQFTLCWEILFPPHRVHSFKLDGIETDRAPPDLARWQFTIRAALPGRSPSCFA